MTITVVGSWELDWMEPRIERNIWRQVICAFEVDHWVMVPGEPGTFSSPHQFSGMPEALSAVHGKRVFLIPPDRRDSIYLEQYKHPEDAVYIFGNGPDNLVRHVVPGDDVVSVYTPFRATPFGHTILPIVLYDRLIKK